jgi:hypothetical protein
MVSQELLLTDRGSGPRLMYIDLHGNILYIGPFASVARVLGRCIVTSGGRLLLLGELIFQCK